MPDVLQNRLLEIAIDAFGRDGPEGASTREIAAAAGTAMSSITYHYGGKQGLYLAAADHIAAEMRERTEHVLAALDGVDPCDPAASRAALHALLAMLVEKMAVEKGPGWGMFIAREQMQPTAAFDRLYQGGMGMLLERMGELVAGATGLAEGARARLTALTLFAQALVIRSSRALFLRLLGRDAVDRALCEMLRDQVRANTDAILNTMMESPR